MAASSPLCVHPCGSHVSRTTLRMSTPCTCATGSDGSLFVSLWCLACCFMLMPKHIQAKAYSVDSAFFGGGGRGPR
eukprot:3085203-Pyramimonas_sp.AAC.1